MNQVKPMNIKMGLIERIKLIINELTVNEDAQENNMQNEVSEIMKEEDDKIIKKLEKSVIDVNIPLEDDKKIVEKVEVSSEKAKQTMKKGKSKINVEKEIEEK